MHRRRFFGRISHWPGASGEDVKPAEKTTRPGTGKTTPPSSAVVAVEAQARIIMITSPSLVVVAVVVEARIIITTLLSSAVVAVTTEARIIMTTPTLSAVVAVTTIIMSKLFVNL